MATLTSLLRNQTIIKYCTLWDMRERFRRDPNTPIELMNELTLRLWQIEDCNPHFDTEIRPILRPYLSYLKQRP